MGNRYLITGVQLGLLVGIPEQAERQKLADEIIDNQEVNVELRNENGRNNSKT